MSLKTFHCQPHACSLELVWYRRHTTPHSRHGRPFGFSNPSPISTWRSTPALASCSRNNKADTCGQQTPREKIHSSMLAPHSAFSPKPLGSSRNMQQNDSATNMRRGRARSTLLRTTRHPKRRGRDLVIISPNLRRTCLNPRMAHSIPLMRIAPRPQSWFARTKMANSQKPDCENGYSQQHLGESQPEMGTATPTGPGNTASEV